MTDSRLAIAEEDRATGDAEPSLDVRTLSACVVAGVSDTIDALDTLDTAVSSLPKAGRAAEFVVDDGTERNILGNSCASYRGGKVSKCTSRCLWASILTRRIICPVVRSFFFDSLVRIGVTITPDARGDDASKTGAQRRR